MVLVFSLSNTSESVGIVRIIIDFIKENPYLAITLLVIGVLGLVLIAIFQKKPSESTFIYILKTIREISSWCIVLPGCGIRMILCKGKTPRGDFLNLPVWKYLFGISPYLLSLLISLLFDSIFGTSFWTIFILFSILFILIIAALSMCTYHRSTSGRSTPRKGASK